MIWPKKKAGLKENYKKPSQLNWKPLHWPEEEAYNVDAATYSLVLGSLPRNIAHI